jgi:hypothetical protein
MIVLIDTSTKIITLGQELRGDKLREVLDTIFPNDEWENYLIKTDVGLKPTYPIVTISTVNKDNGLFPWNSGYTLRKASTGFMSANVKNINKSNASMTVDVSKAKININIPTTFTVEI